MKSEPAPSEQTRHYPCKANYRGGFIVLLAVCIIASAAWTQVREACNAHSGTTLFFGTLVLSPDNAAVWRWLGAGFCCLLLLFFIMVLLLWLINSRKPSFVELHPDALLITTDFRKQVVRIPLADIAHVSEAADSGIPCIHLVTIHRKHFFFSTARFHDPIHYTEIREFLIARPS
jgi:hypothetical protein